MSQRISQPRQKSSSTIGTSATEPNTRKATKTKLSLASCGTELRAEPSRKLSNSQCSRYAGQNTSGVIQSTNTAMPIRMLPAQLRARNEMRCREQTTTTIPTTTTRSGYRKRGDTGSQCASAMKAMNAAKGATYGTAGCLMNKL